MANAQSPDEDTPVPTTEIEAPASVEPSTVTEDEWAAMQNLLDTVYEYRTTDGHDPSKVFHRKVNKRFVPDYYQVITDPIALSTVKTKINQKAYKNFPEIVRDFALIVHNAQVYNRPDAGAYHDALEVKQLVEAKLEKLVNSKMITAETAKFPFLGEIPPQDDLPAEDNQGGEEDDDDDEEGSEEGGDDTDDSRGRRKSKAKTRVRTKIEDDVKDDAQAVADAEARRKRGRPPKVDTPMEARLKNILKGMRRFKNQADETMLAHFDRLPDRLTMPGYYEEIKSPIAMDILKKKVKRKKYASIDQFMQDANLMFDNAKAYNEDDSQIYKDAVTLQKETQKLADMEMKKPDTEFVMEDGRLPLPEGILHNGELYQVGDWVHIQNKNDLTKPIVSQIYRTWQDANGQKFVNACWYYRPEQTVHRFDKHFYESEVVKTGQYRDHSIYEVVDRCFVMFITRFNKGRPRNLPRDKDIYVCESRYNEEKFTLNKIKTWASCLPDEVRDKDYEMELYQEPKRMKKQPSPIAYLLKDSQKETDELPKPEWGADNAPPKIGAVHRRPREAKDSPPPEPTPSPEPEPTPPPPPPVRQVPPSMPPQQASGYSRAPNPNFTAPRSSQQSAAVTTAAPQSATISQPQMRPFQPTITPASSIQGLPQLSRINSYSAHTPQAPSASRAGLPSTDLSNLTQRFQQPNSQSLYGTSNATSYKAPQPIEVWSLNDAANLAIPADIREQFQRDDAGRVLFFTAPPIDTLEMRSSEKANEVLGHSVSYLAAKAERDAKVREARKRKIDLAIELAESRRTKARAEQEEVELQIRELTIKAVELWKRQMVGEKKGDFDRRDEVKYGEAEMLQSIAQLQTLTKDAITGSMSDDQVPGG